MVRKTKKNKKIPAILIFYSIIDFGCLKRGRSYGLKTFFDSIFIDCNDDQYDGEYPIKLEYYKLSI